MAKNKGGRPSKYTKALANLICERIATHDIGLQRLCDMYDDMPAKITINQWRYKHPEFSTQYALAKMIQVELLAESIDDMAHEIGTYVDGEGNTRIDAGFVAWQRLKIDTRKFTISKLLPKIFGDYKPNDIPVELKNKSDEKLVITTTDPIEGAKIYQQFMFNT